MESRFCPENTRAALCGRGELEGSNGLTESPTADVEAQHRVFSFAAANKTRLNTADTSNAYFEGGVRRSCVSSILNTRRRNIDYRMRAKKMDRELLSNVLEEIPKCYLREWFP